MTITRVGFGAWAIGGAGWASGWGPQDDADSIAAIRHAVTRGVNWIDTAAIYGLGHSEELVGQALKGMSAGERPYIFTKCGMVWDKVQPTAPPRRVGSAQHLRAGLDASLKRLGVERIDLLQMHWPANDGTPLDEYWQTLLDLKREGKVRSVGLSNHNVAQLEDAERLGHVDTLQPPFSAIRRDAAADLLPWCAAHETGVLVYSPMQSGLLSGGFSEERAASLPADDWRSRNAEFSGANLRRNLALAQALQRVAERHGTTVAATAIAWTLAWQGVTGAIVGARQPRQVDGWLGAATLDLDDDDMAQIAAFIETTGVGTGPSSPARQAGADLPLRDD
jgi:aryl-alcohol dehydrogenase-like predicted oxidoreductase